MTREEAMLLLHDMKDTYDEIHENTNCEIGYEQMTALDMAIEALSSDAIAKAYNQGFVEGSVNATVNSNIEALSLANLKEEFESADAEFTDLPDIPRYYYEKVVGKMAHEINILKEQLESAEAVEWIPCSERLPRTGDDILVTFSDGEVDIIISARPKVWVKYEEANNIFPVAWMPLPKPYKGGDDE